MSNYALLHVILVRWRINNRHRERADRWPRQAMKPRTYTHAMQRQIDVALSKAIAPANRRRQRLRAPVASFIRRFADIVLGA